MKEWDALFPEINETQYRQFAQFEALLQTWNQRMNLVSRKDVVHLRENHLLPSLIAVKQVEIPVQGWLLDIGSGGGFPAIPLSILRPGLQVRMVDSIRKKTQFLKTVIAELGLKNTDILRERAEVLNQHPEYQNKFDIVTARAVASIEQLLSWGSPFLKKNGIFLLWKGTSDIPELKAVGESTAVKYQIFNIPEALQAFSPKFKELCLFMIHKK